jgi:hypothetical protein
MLGLPMSLNLTPVKPLAVGPKQRSPLKAGILSDLQSRKTRMWPMATGRDPDALRTSCRRTGQSQ